MSCTLRFGSTYRAVLASFSVCWQAHIVQWCYVKLWLWGYVLVPTPAGPVQFESRSIRLSVQYLLTSAVFTQMCRKTWRFTQYSLHVLWTHLHPYIFSLNKNPENAFYFYFKEQLRQSCPKWTYQLWSGWHSCRRSLKRHCSCCCWVHGLQQAKRSHGGTVQYWFFHLQQIPVQG